jgi:hypothetical protein
MTKSIMAQLPNQIIMDIIKKSTELKRQPYNSVMVELLSFDAEKAMEDEVEYHEAWEDILEENLVEPLYRGGMYGGIHIDDFGPYEDITQQQWTKAELLLDRLGWREE